MINIKILREETPSALNTIHFNNAGAALQPNPVYNAVTTYLKDEFEMGGYECAAKYNQQLSGFYDSVAQLINCGSDEIAYMESATVAWDSIFYSIPFETGDRIITSRTEYASNYIAFLQVQKRFGAEIILIDQQHDGMIDLDSLKKEAENPKTKLIAITHMPTNRGILNPAEKIGEIASATEVLFLLDACQTVGQYPIDVNRIHCDFLSSTGRKYLRGPRGTGFLYVNKKHKNMEPFSLDLHSAEWSSEDQYEIAKNATRFEKWESNLAGKLGLKVAAEYAYNIGLEHIWNRIQSLANTFRQRLKDIDELELLDLGTELGGIVSFRIKNKDCNQIKQYLSNNRINVSVAVESGTLLDMKPRKIKESIRASVHYYNSEDEIESVVDVLKNMP